MKFLVFYYFKLLNSLKPGYILNMQQDILLIQRQVVCKDIWDDIEW